MRFRIFAVSSIFVAILLALPVLLAQGDETILTILVQEWQRDVYNSERFADFEAAHPGVKVVVETMGPDDFLYGSAFGDLDEFREQASNFASKADVLPVSNYSIAPDATRGGYFLDMAPLISGDASLDVDDFFPAMLQSYQWDGATWALPVSGSVNVLMYDRNAFDEAGLPYPDESWTISDFLTAGRDLTTYLDNGEIDRPALIGFNNSILFRALLGHGLYDDSVIPEQPALADADLAAMLDAWQAYQDELFGDSGPDFSRVEFNTMPINIGGIFMLDSTFTTGSGASNVDYEASLLPGGVSVVNAEGFAISAGTQHPELAYDLIKYLITDVEVVSRYFGDSPALRSMVGQEPDEEFFGPQRSEESQAIIDMALEVAIPASETRYFDNAMAATFDNPEDPLPNDTLEALGELQTRLIEKQAELAGMAETSTMLVATPVPTPVLTTEEIALKFHVYENISPIPNRDEWEALVAEFASIDPDVGFIELSTGFSPGGDDRGELDCFYRSTNAVPSFELSTLLALDPFLAADPSFDADELIPNVLEQVTREGQVWAYPVTIQPMVLWYNRQIGEQAGAFPPYSGWTITDFVDALQQIRIAEGEAPFRPAQSGSTYLIMLATAFGASPIDYTTEPPTYHLDDPAVLDALRQTLDLVKDGYIEYNALGDALFGGGGGGGFGNSVPVYESYLNQLDFRFTNRNEDETFAETYQMVSFPRGMENIPVSYEVGAGYINSGTLNPKACYRLLTFISQSPTLFPSMPVRPAMIDQISDGEDMISTYQDLADVLSQPNTVTIPTPFAGFGNPGSLIVQIWMNRAFDAYVLEDADLEIVLAEAQTYINDYRVCTDSIEERTPEELSNMEQEEAIAYSSQFSQCAVDVDPTLSDLLAPLLGTAED